MSGRAEKIVPLIERNLADENFAHCLRMVPMMHLWAHEMREGHKVTFNDRNMVHIPMEMLMAFIRDHAKGQGPLPAVCREVLEGIVELEQFRTPIQGELGDR